MSVSKSVYQHPLQAERLFLHSAYIPKDILGQFFRLHETFPGIRIPIDEALLADRRIVFKTLVESLQHHPDSNIVLLIPDLCAQDISVRTPYLQARHLLTMTKNRCMSTTLDDSMLSVNSPVLKSVCRSGQLSRPKAASRV